MYSVALTQYDDELYHHGILGMHWGIRRFQNKDGSLTQKGRERLGREKSRKSSSEKQDREREREREREKQAKAEAVKKYAKEKALRAADKLLDNMIDSGTKKLAEYATNKLLDNALKDYNKYKQPGGGKGGRK